MTPEKTVKHCASTCVAATALIAFGVAFASVAAHAQNQAPLLGGVSGAIVHAGTGATIPVEERLRTQLRAAMAELIANGAFGDQAPEKISLDVSTPSQRVSDLGVLVDAAGPANNGLHVLGVTPGSAAEKMGLHAGDVLLAANGARLAGDGAAARLRDSVQGVPNGGTLAVEVDRKGRSQDLSGTLASVYVPAMQLHVGDDAVQVASGGPRTVAIADSAAGCGRISDFDVAPRQQQLHGAKILLIDGVTPGPSGATSFRVTPGSHVVTVVNEIDSKYLPFNDMQRNSGTSRSHYKKLTVDVRPDTTTLIAARLNTDQRNEWQRDAYWDPVAWKQVTESCR